MSFKDFQFPDVSAELGLRMSEADLFPHVPPVAVSAEFLGRLRDDAAAALAVNTEKARSEYIVAPLLLELRRLPGLSRRCEVFSGVGFSVDAGRGLDGFCDFLLTRSGMQTVLTPPAVVVVEAKNDNLRTGLGQCIATMVAAWEWNQKSPDPASAVYGAVTTGAAWRFLRLVGSDLTLDRRELFVTETERILSILAHILATA